MKLESALKHLLQKARLNYVVRDQSIVIVPAE
jgi:hypothetical protein